MEGREVCLADSAAVFGFLSFLLPSGMNTSVLHCHRKHLDLWDLSWLTNERKEITCKDILQS